MPFSRFDLNLIGQGLINVLILDPEGRKSPGGKQANINKCVGVQRHSQTSPYCIPPFDGLGLGLDHASCNMDCFLNLKLVKMRIDVVLSSHAL